MPYTTLAENIVADSALRVDRESGVIFGVKCLGRESRNGRTYLDTALEDARGFYEGADVNVDHPVGDEINRRMADGFGVLRNARLHESGVFADLHYLKSHPLAEPIAERAEKFPQNFGMSHVARGSIGENAAGDVVVEAIHEVVSVDIVNKPATNAGLFESQNGGRKSMPTKKQEERTVRQVLEANRKDQTAAKLLLLIEEEPFVAMAEEPVAELAPEANADDQIKSAFRAMVIAAFDDDSLDSKATVTRIKEILAAQEKLAEPKKKAEDKGEGDAEGAAAVAEAIQTENATLRRKLEISEAMEEASVNRADLSQAQRRVLDRCTKKSEASDLLESWEGLHQKPVIGRKITKSGDGGEYETLSEARKRHADRSQPRR